MMVMLRAGLLATLLLFLSSARASVNEDKVCFEGGQFHVQQKLYYFEDTSAKVTFTDVQFVQMTPLPEGVPNLDVSRSAHWLKFDLTNNSKNGKIILSIAHPEIDELDAYFVLDGVSRHIGHTGQLRARAERIQPYEGFRFDVDLPAGSTGSIFIRAHGFKHIHLPIAIEAVGSIVRSSARHNFLTGGYIAVMLTLILYNLFVFISIKDRNYIWYILNIGVISLAQLGLLGVIQEDLFGNNRWLASRSSILFALLAIVTGLQYARNIINTKQLLPTLDKVFPFVFAVIGIDLIIYFFSDPWFGYKSAQIISGLSASYLLVLVVAALRSGSRQAIFFMVAWTPFLIGVLMFVMKDAGILPYTSFTRLAMPIGSAIEGILLSFGLADRINILRREKEQSQAEALKISKENEKIILEQNVVLEEKVRQRTFALQESNEHLKRTQTQLVNAEKMASLGQLTAGIAHEINNPINFITSNIHPLKRNIGEIVEVINDHLSIDPDQATEQIMELRAKADRMGITESIQELDDIIKSIAEGSARTAEIVRGLRNFSRLDESDLKWNDLNEGIRSTITVLAPQFRDRVTMRMELGELPKVECYAGKVNQVLMNILTNAIQATLAVPGDHERVVSITNWAAGDHVIIAIKDNGTGISDEVKQRMFDPFFTTKPVGEGTGLGLAIVYGIIQDHFGHLEVESSPGGGAEFKIILPIRHQQLNERRA